MSATSESDKRESSTGFMASHPKMKATLKTTVITGLIATAGAIIVALITALFAYLSHQYDLDAKLIDLSVAVLRADATKETKPVREWAIETLETNAKFKFTESQRSTLLEHQLPMLSTGDGSAPKPTAVPK